MAVDKNTSPAAWWNMFASDTPHLQQLALRIVSQCASSSGCERNWSTFALIHMKVRNRLSQEKLHKLLYVNYNLQIRMRDVSWTYKPPEADPFDRLMELSLYDSSNPIREWMEHGRSNSDPVLNEEGTETDSLVPSHLVTDDDAGRQLLRLSRAATISEWADQNVGDTHIGKRKVQSARTKKVLKDEVKKQRER